MIECEPRVALLRKWIMVRGVDSTLAFASFVIFQSFCHRCCLLALHRSAAHIYLGRDDLHGVHVRLLRVFDKVCLHCAFTGAQHRETLGRQAVEARVQVLARREHGRTSRNMATACPRT